MPFPPHLAGKHAFVTGGSRGIGAGIARALTDAGASVTILGRTEKTLAEAVKSGIAAHYAVADVTDPDALERAVDAAEARAPLDIVVANAGVAESAPIKRMTRALFDRMIATNLTAVFDTMRLTIPRMAERKRGRFIAIASMAGLYGAPYISGYVASKHGVVGLVRALGREVAPSGVTVNAICPGYIETDLVDEPMRALAEKTGRPYEELKSELIKNYPIGRFIKVEEVAAAVLWLASDEAGAVTGTPIPISAGGAL